MIADENSKWLVLIYGYDGDKQYFKEIIGPPMTFEEADEVAGKVDDKELSLSEYAETVLWRDKDTKSHNICNWR
jgi:hypothetical protein